MSAQKPIPEFHTLLPHAFFFTAIVLTIVMFLNPEIGVPELMELQMFTAGVLTGIGLFRQNGQMFVSHLMALINLTMIDLTTHTVTPRLIWTYVVLAACAKIFVLSVRFIRQRYAAVSRQ